MRSSVRRELFDGRGSRLSAVTYSEQKPAAAQGTPTADVPGCDPAVLSCRKWFVCSASRGAPGVPQHIPQHSAPRLAEHEMLDRSGGGIESPRLKARPEAKPGAGTLAERRR